MKPMECYPTLTQCIQDEYNWDYVKRVANSVYLTIVNPSAKLKFGIHDPTQKFYEDNLPKMLKDVLLEALLYPGFEKSTKFKKIRISLERTLKLKEQK